VIKIANGVLAVIGGVGGVVAFFFILNYAVERAPARVEQALKPYVFVGPALAVVGLFLVFPGVRTVYLSLFDRTGDTFVGAQNYTEILGEESIRTVIANNIIWLLVVPSFSVAIGLVVAVLADRLKPRWENITKSVIFLPMAISFVGASTIWGFIYTIRSSGSQIGLLNGIVVALGFEPTAWLNTPTFKLNTLLLTVIMIWLQAGFAMVLLSAAIKSVPDETVEAARIDGATEVQIFWRVVIPQIKSTIFVVTTTILILVLKVFDIVFVLTAGNFGTDVIAVRFINELFRFGNPGRASTLVVVLMVAVVPVMIANIRRFREEEALR
jgi:alpha-glucoside transport system permease protein